MQVTNISLWSLRGLLHQVIRGYRMAGYTVRPGFSNGLIFTNKRPPLSGYVGLQGHSK